MEGTSRGSKPGLVRTGDRRPRRAATARRRPGSGVAGDRGARGELPTEAEVRSRPENVRGNGRKRLSHRRSHPRSGGTVPATVTQKQARAPAKTQRRGERAPGNPNDTTGLSPPGKRQVLQATLRTPRGNATKTAHAGPRGQRADVGGKGPRPRPVRPDTEGASLVGTSAHGRPAQARTPGRCGHLPAPGWRGRRRVSCPAQCAGLRGRGLCSETRPGTTPCGLGEERTDSGTQRRVPTGSEVRTAAPQGTRQK